MDIKAMKCTIKDIVCFVSSVTLLIPMLAQNNYTIAVTPSEVPIRGSNVLLTQGEAMKVTLTTEESSTMNDVSFSARRVGFADPFGSAQIPFTIELYESDKLVASESFTWLLDDKLEEITTSINNTPKLDERYKMLIRYDVPEGNGIDVPIQIDAESIKINGGEDGIDIQGRIKVLFSIN
jgi:hypothetical protein